jgi:hypothetical protein
MRPTASDRFIPLTSVTSSLVLFLVAFDRYLMSYPEVVYLSSLTQETCPARRTGLHRREPSTRRSSRADRTGDSPYRACSGCEGNTPMDHGRSPDRSSRERRSFLAWGRTALSPQRRSPGLTRVILLEVYAHCDPAIVLRPGVSESRMEGERRRAQDADQDHRELLCARLNIPDHLQEDSRAGETIVIGVRSSE